MSALSTRELLVPKYTKRRKGTNLKSIRGIVIHNTGNTDKGANADANARYQKNSCNDAVNGWHWTVDEHEAVLSIPESEVAEHAGKRLYNDTTVAIEICENTDGDLFMATENGAKLAAQILKRQGFTKAVSQENIFQHFHANSKNCPSRIRAGQPYGWDEFVRRVNVYMGNASESDSKPPTATPNDPPTIPTTNIPNASNGSIPLPEGILYFQVKTTQRVYFRTTPEIKKDNIKVTLDTGTNLKFRGELGEYYKVSYNGEIGYVAKRLCAPNYTGSKTDVKTLQSALGITVDGLYGRNTALAVGAVQASHRLTVDYIYGSNTRKAILSDK